MDNLVDNIYNDISQLPDTRTGNNQMVRKPSRKAPTVSNAAVSGGTGTNRKISFHSNMRQNSNMPQPNINQLRQQIERQPSYQRRRNSRDQQSNQNYMSLLTQREAGNAQKSRKSIEEKDVVKPIPAAGRPKPALPKKLPKARVIYSYAAADTDEIGITENEVVTILQEGKKK